MDTGQLKNGVNYKWFNKRASNVPIVVVNGWSVRISTMGPFLNVLSKEFSDSPILCLATDDVIYEQPHSRAHRVDVFTDSLKQLINLNAMHLIAHSEAAITATHYAYKHSKVKSLQLIAPAGMNAVDARQLQSKLFHKAVNGFWRVLSGSVPLGSYVSLVMGGVKQITRRLTHTQKQLKSAHAHTLTDELKLLVELQTPLQVLAYTDDMMFSLREVTDVLEKIGAPKATILDGSHDELIYNPHETVQKIKSFLHELK